MCAFLKTRYYFIDICPFFWYYLCRYFSFCYLPLAAFLHIQQQKNSLGFLSISNNLLYYYIPPSWCCPLLHHLLLEIPPTSPHGFLHSAFFLTVQPAIKLSLQNTLSSWNKGLVLGWIFIQKCLAIFWPFARTPSLNCYRQSLCLFI